MASRDEKLADLTSRHNDSIDSVVGNFQAELEAMVGVALARLQAKLIRELVVDEFGRVVSSPSNLALLRQVAQTFDRYLGDAGYSDLVEELIRSFNRQFPFFEEALAILKLPKVNFGKADREAFVTKQMTFDEALKGMVRQVAESAQRQALLSIGSIGLGDLAELLARETGKTMPEAARLADTSMNIYYRTISKRGFEQIEKGRGVENRYRYYGPDDKKTRVYCEDMLARTADKGLTFAEIEGFPNGQLPNPFETGGGYNCRHWYILDTRGPSNPDPNPPNGPQPDLPQAPPSRPPFGEQSVATMGEMSAPAYRALERELRIKNRDRKVVITEDRFNHFRERHPELNWNEAALAMLRPDRIVLDTKNDNTALFMRQRPSGDWTIAVVRLAQSRGREKHSLISARVQRNRTASKLGKPIWEKDE
jgi:hypothetical protein